MTDNNLNYIRPKKLPWVEQFLSLHGRRPRILHVGNIANNAYLNARILNDFGIENHIAANDLYHFGSCPEWYDSNGQTINRSKLGDDFFPNFWAAGLSGEVRPRWFAQAPQFMTINYLKMLCTNHPMTELAWWALEYSRFKASICKNTIPEKLVLSNEEFNKHISESNIKGDTLSWFNKIREYQYLYDGILDTIISIYGENVREQIGLPLPIEYVDSFKPWGNPEIFAKWEAARREGILAAIGFEAMQLENSEDLLPVQGVSEDDRIIYQGVLKYWNDLFSHYDNIILYATQPILGLLTNRNYLCYEHGTIRSIPFDDNTLGRLTKLSYERSAGVFITNIDYVTAKKRIEFDEDKKFYIPHGFDERPLIEFREKNYRFAPPNDKIIFFWPTRQDWLSRDARMAKQNDVAILAAKLVKKATSKKFKIITVEWGVDVEASKQLINSLGLTDYFEWIKPVNKQRLWQYYMESHCVIDQFIGSSVNGITSEAMMMARPVMCYDDGICANVAYGSSPPYLTGETPEDLKEGFLKIINDPTDNAGIGQKSLDWMLKHHTRPIIAEIFAKALASSPNIVINDFVDKLPVVRKKNFFDIIINRINIIQNSGGLLKYCQIHLKRIISK